MKTYKPKGRFFSLRSRLFYFLTKSVPEGQILPSWAIGVRSVLFPVDMLDWALTRANHWDVLTNQYIIHGVKYSASFFDTLACKDEGAFLFKREGDTLTFIAFDASEKTTQDEIDDSDSVESDELVDQRAVSRGGSWGLLPKGCRSAYRCNIHFDFAGFGLGFRVCCLSAKKSNLPQKITSINNEVSRLVPWLIENAIIAADKGFSETAGKFEYAAHLLESLAENPWRAVIDDALVCRFLLTEELENNPHKALNEIINWELQVSRDPLVTDMSQFSDGYHTFAELYEHRHALCLALMKALPSSSWFSWRHADGERCFGGDEWFIVGIELPGASSVTYHLPAKFYELAKATGARELERGRQWDGHTAADVVQRLHEWVESKKPQESSIFKLLRGGSWGDYFRFCRSAFHDPLEPDYTGFFIGFRVCCLSANKGQ